MYFDQWRTTMIIAVWIILGIGIVVVAYSLFVPAGKQVQSNANALKAQLSQLEMLRAEKQSLTDELNRARADLDERAQALAETQAKLADDTNAHEAARETDKAALLQAEQDNQELQQRLQDVQQLLEKHTQRIHDYETEQQAREAELQASQESLQVHQQRAAQAQAETRTLADQLTQAQQGLKELESLRTQLAEVQSNANALKAQLSQLEMLRAEKQSLTDELNRARADLDERAQALAETQAKLADDTNAHEAARETDKAALLQAEQDNQELLSAMRRMRTEIGALRTSNQELQVVRDDQCKQVEDDREKWQNLEQELTQIREDNDMLLKTLEQARLEAKEAKEDLVKKETMLASYFAAGSPSVVVPGGEDQPKTSEREEKTIGKEKQDTPQARCVPEQKKRIGEIMIENHYIAPDTLDKALKYIKTHGGGLTQYLLAYGFIDENQLAHCLCTQFGFPYLPLGSFEIASEISQIVPVTLAQQYCLVPVDRVNNVLTVVMADPLDVKAIEELKTVTGYDVQPFVGIISDIRSALCRYYNIPDVTSGDATKTPPPLFIQTQEYTGIERRKSIRLKAKLDIHFPLQQQYKKSHTKDISRGGLLFESEKALPVGSYVMLQIDLPHEFSPLPIVAIVQVVRIVSAGKMFDIGARIVKIAQEDQETILHYVAATQEGKE